MFVQGWGREGGRGPAPPRPPGRSPTHGPGVPTLESPPLLYFRQSLASCTLSLPVGSPWVPLSAAALTQHPQLEVTPIALSFRGFPEPVLGWDPGDPPGNEGRSGQYTPEGPVPARKNPGWRKARAGVGHLSAGGQGWSCGPQEEACPEQGAWMGPWMGGAEGRRGMLVPPKATGPAPPYTPTATQRRGAKPERTSPPPFPLILQREY